MNMYLYDNNSEKESREKETLLKNIFYIIKKINCINPN